MTLVKEEPLTIIRTIAWSTEKEDQVAEVLMEIQPSVWKSAQGTTWEEAELNLKTSVTSKIRKLNPELSIEDAYAQLVMLNKLGV